MLFACQILGELYSLACWHVSVGATHKGNQRSYHHHVERTGYGEPRLHVEAYPCCLSVVSENIPLPILTLEVRILAMTAFSGPSAPCISPWCGRLGGHDVPSNQMIPTSKIEGAKDIICTSL